jgi:hypothetical protein
MDRTLQYVFGGVVSSALIAGAVAAFITITSLVASNSFPDGHAVQPLAGPESVRIAAPGESSQSRAVPGPTGPVAAADSAAIRHLASLRRQLIAGTAQSGASAAARGRQAGSSPGAGHRSGGSSPHSGSGTGPGSSGNGNGSSPPGSTPQPPPSGGPPPPSGGGEPPTPPPTTTPPPSSTPSGLASKPGGLPPGLAKKGGTSPGQAKQTGTPLGQAKQTGTPPGLASKPGGVPPGQAKKG